MTHPDWPQRRSIEISGSRLSLIDEGEGPPVLLGHGYLWDSAMWAPQIKALGQRNRLIVPDMWGHGHSGPLPPGTHTLADLAGHMLGLLDELEIERCVVAGLSMAGMWGAHLAASAPDRVAGLVIMNSFLGEEPVSSRTAYAGLLDAVEATGGFPPEVVEIALPLFFAPDINERRPGLRERLNEQIAAYGADQVRRSIVPLGRLIFEREDGLGLLADIRCPHLIVAGATDLARPPEESIRMSALLGSEPAIIADCGHTSSLEQGDEVSRILGEFLTEIGWRN